ncbi:uncharacterized protein [Procambarus clarkii]|uniref:uncharacterized protein n=1 Tax=Procambarus clarkii TaxID=6728 RepID=UPI0037438761
MKFLVVLALAWCCSAQFVPNNFIAPYPFAQQYRAQDILGQSTFGYYGINQNRHETRLADGSVVGHYSYIGADGKPAVTFYEAGAGRGYRVRSNVLPEAEQVELSAPVHTLEGPNPVEDTPEVVKARAEFKELYNEAKLRGKRQVAVYNYPTAAVNVPKYATDNSKVTAHQVPGTSPFFYTYPINPIAPYASYPFAYPGFPFFVNPLAPKTDEEIKPEVEPEVEAVVEARRRRREVQFAPVPLVYSSVPVANYAKFKTQKYEAVESDTPADTTKIELKTKEYKVPALPYTYPFNFPYTAFQPYSAVAQVPTDKATKYIAGNPAFLPYSAAFPYFRPYTVVAAPAKKN